MAKDRHSLSSRRRGTRGIGFLANRRKSRYRRFYSQRYVQAAHVVNLSAFFLDRLLMQRPDSVWRSGCRKLAEAQAALDFTNPETVRDCLAQLDAAMRAAPWNIRTIYAEFPEAELEEATRTQSAAILRGDKSWARGLVQTRQCLLALAIQIRSLDHILHGMDTRYSRAPSDPMREWLCKSGNAFVIPARRRRDLGRTAGDKLSYGRRGTRITASSLPPCRKCRCASCPWLRLISRPPGIASH